MILKESLLFKKVISVWIGILILHLFSLEASPIGYYIRPTLTVCSKDRMYAVHLAHQFNRGRLMELAFRMPYQKETIPITFIDKHSLPINHYCNLYTAWGFSLSSSIAVYRPFVGMGAAYHMNPKWHIDISWHCYKPLSFLSKDFLTWEKHDLRFGIGYYLG